MSESFESTNHTSVHLLLTGLFAWLAVFNICLLFCNDFVLSIDWFAASASKKVTVFCQKKKEK